VRAPALGTLLLATAIGAHAPSRFILAGSRVTAERAFFGGHRVGVRFRFAADGPMTFEWRSSAGGSSSSTSSCGTPRPGSCIASAGTESPPGAGLRGTGATGCGSSPWAAGPGGPAHSSCTATSIRCAGRIPRAGLAGSSASRARAAAGTRASTSSRPAGRLSPAARAGRVKRSTYDPVLYGHLLVIHGRRSHRDYWYAHLAHRPRLRRGSTVRTGQRVGRVGASGNARTVSCHLHFEIRSRGRPIDPRPHLRRWDRHS
jgi:Peptidase family M23